MDNNMQKSIEDAAQALFEEMKVNVPFPITEQFLEYHRLFVRELSQLVEGNAANSATAIRDQYVNQ